MPVGLKLEGFKRLVNSLKRINEDFDITSCEIGKNAYNGYAIFRIEGTNISIFENFNEVNARLFIVKNELIDQVRQLSRNDATAIDGVEAVNHVSNFENYCKNLREKVLILIRETSPKQEHEETIVKVDNYIDSLQNITKNDLQKKEILEKIDKNPNLIDSLSYNRLKQLNQIYEERNNELEIKLKMLKSN